MNRRAVLWTVVGSGLAALALVLTLAAGWRFFTVLTPSMGVTAPVGTLVVTHPADRYAVGDIVSYDNTKGRIYTHRITEVLGDGSFVTKGDLNDAPDPFAVRPDQVVGRAAALLPAWGWVLRGLPWLVIGFLLVYVVSLLPRISEPWRWVMRITGATFVVALVAVWLRPWVGLDMLGFTPATGGGVDMRVVNVGLFPLDVVGTRISSGQDALVHVTHQNAAGLYELTPTLALSWWQQALVWLASLVPLVAALLIRVPATPETTPEGPAREPGRSRLRRLALIGAICVSVVAGVGVVTLSATHSALSAAVQNTKNSAGARPTCRGAIANLGSTSPTLAYAMGTAGTKSEPDVSRATGNAGQYSVTTTTQATYGCQQDDPKVSVVFDGASQCLASPTTYPNPQLFSLEAWFSTSSPKAGKIIGFGATQFTPTESTYDRHVYIDNAGRIVFGVYIGGYSTVSTASGKSYADGRWHHVVATYSGGSGGTGVKLYVDGVQVAANAAFTNAETTTGYWKIGCGNLANWPNAAGTTLTSTNSASWFNGRIQYAAVYPVALTAPQVTAHYQAGAA